MSRLSEKNKALSENGQGILCFAVMLLLNAVAFIVNTLGEFRVQMSVSTNYTQRMSFERKFFDSPINKISTIIITLLFVFLLFVFCKKSVEKSAENGTKNFVLLGCICPVFLLGFAFIRHSAGFVAVMLAALIAVIMAESKKTLWLVPIVSAFGTFLNAGFAFTFLPAILLSLCGEREDKTFADSSKKTVKASAAVCLILFAFLVVSALLGDGTYIGAVDLTQIADINIYGVSSYDGEIPLVVTNALSLFLICIPALYLSVFFWLAAMKNAKENGRKTAKLFIFCIASNAVIIPAFFFTEPLGIWMLFDVFAQYILMLSLASSREPSVLEAMKKFDEFFNQKKRLILIVFAFLFEFLICAYIENKL